MTDPMDTPVSQDLGVFLHESSWLLGRSGWIERDALDRVDAQESVGRTAEFRTIHTLRDVNVSSFFFVCGT